MMLRIKFFFFRVFSYKYVRSYECISSRLELKRRAASNTQILETKQ